MVERVNKLSDEQLKDLIKNKQCPYEPEHLVGEPTGMFHCPVCGEMVIASLPHYPDKSNG